MTDRNPAETTTVKRLGVSVRQLSAAYGADPVLRSVDLEVAPGEIVALLGPSGCGKTTLLRCIAGLESPTGGSIAIGDDAAGVATGNDPGPSSTRRRRAHRTASSVRRRVGMVFQDGALFPHLSVIDNVRYGLDRHAREHDGERAHELLRMVGLADKAERMPGTLSGGEQQRVALARALAPRPGVILLDEPFSSLDAALRVQLRVEVRRLLKAVGVTAIFVTHDQEEALMLGDRVAVMRAGRLEQIGTPVDLYVRPVSTWVASFVGEANLLDAEPLPSSPTSKAAEGVAAGAGEARVSTVIGDVPIDAGGGPALDGPALVLCRPEQIEVTAATETAQGDVGPSEAVGPGSGATASAGAGEVVEVTYFGPDTQYRLRMGGERVVTARAYGVPRHVVGDAVAVRFRGSAAAVWPVGEAARKREA